MPNRGLGSILGSHPCLAPGASPRPHEVGFRAANILQAGSRSPHGTRMWVLVRLPEVDNVQVFLENSQQCKTAIVITDFSVQVVEVLHAVLK